jgi:protein disulfide-isomerase A1
VLEQGKAAVTDLNTAEEAKAFVAESSAAVTVLAFGAASEAFSATADALRMDGFSFAHSDDAAVAEAFGVTVAAGATMVVAFKKFDAPQVPFAGAEFTTEALTAFLTAESFPSFGEIGPDTYRKYVDRKLPLVYYFVDPSSEAEKAVTEAGKAVAPTYKGQLSFVAIDGVQYAKHGESLGATQTPMIVVHDMEKNKKFVTSKVTEAEQREFFEQWAAGTLQPFKKSAAVPAPQAVKGVQVLVGLNFEEVAFDKTKDVLVEVCGLGYVRFEPCVASYLLYCIAISSCPPAAFLASVLRAVVRPLQELGAQVR